MEQVTVGQIIRVHGLNGQVRVNVLSDVPQRFEPGASVYINDARYTVEASSTFRGDQILLALRGVEDRDAAEKLVGQWITIPPESAPALPEGEWFHFQLVGLRVVTDDGEELGELTEILETGSNDVYVVSPSTSSPGKSQILIPALKNVISQVDLEDGVMRVALPDGLR